MSVREAMGYVCPNRVSGGESLIEAGGDSVEKSGHTLRIHDILGCYYTHVSEIPSEPVFDILNNGAATESKLIKFDNDNFTNDVSFGNNTKSILFHSCRT